ncbi:TonB-dependent siderophore receptor [Marinomonas transparens]|uniref:TonB-dependent siderophore receptor n=1 Tax=Marinomonas transparens TaxID=2795388 RepID=A0A934N6V6_9GAMM|nr:TonB-dependent siderophore receptor [Marinomonas transparens]MBJ7538436.1 TonB-dependent siderophore receptor [Marinomonas transparens]
MPKYRHTHLSLYLKVSPSLPIKVASIALLTLFPKTLLATEIENSIVIPTLTIEGNALYDTESSEEMTGYNVEAATVGTKTPAALKDIPQSITVLTNDYLKDRNIIHLDDVAKVTPGLRTLSNDSGRSSIFSRGYEYDEALIDGLPAPISSVYGSLPSLSAFDRVEIMRGPSGLFSSTSELGGIINLVRKRATSDTQGSVNLGLGSWGRNQLSADLSGALNEDESVRSRIVLSHADAPNEVDQNENTDQSLYATLDIDLDDKTELSVAALHQTKSITPSNGLPSYADGSLLDVAPSTFLGANWNDFNYESTDLFLDLTRQFANGGRGRIAGRYSERDTDFQYAFTGSSVDSLGNTSLADYRGDRSETAWALDASYSQPFEAMGNINEFVVGIDHKKDKNHFDSSYDRNIGSININTFNSSNVSYAATNYSDHSKGSSSEKGIYGKLTFRPIDNLALITGARVSTYDIDNGKQTKSETHQLTSYAGAVYDLTSSQAFYSSYSEVFKPQTQSDVNGNIIAPRVGEQYEIGLKGSYDNGLLNSRISLFQLTDENRATSITGNTYEASGKTQVRGFEAELSGQYGAWDMLMGYTYMDTKNISGDKNANFSSMPLHTLSTWAKYKMPTLEGITVGAGLTAMSDFYYERGTRINAAGYAIVDASVSKQINDDFKVSLNIKNLLDNKYYERVGTTGTFNFYGPSRSFMINANYSF